MCYIKSHNVNNKIDINDEKKTVSWSLGRYCSHFVGS